ncbi:MAG: MBL fold metallo-hydrolase [Lachnospiraceae bacterium]|nr:MBL fold metallo-hydrolase [Lachnospiraceae bacterium]
MTENIEVFEQNSIRITLKNGKKIYIDPFHIAQNTGDADYVFLTHDHYDHYSVEDINKVVKNETMFVYPKKMEKTVGKDFPGKSSLAVLPGEEQKTEDFSFETVPAYNIIKPFHPKSSGWVGYIFQIDGVSIYIAGDTDATKEAAAVRCDVALVPIGGTYTMDAAKAAELVNKILPKTAIPVHYGMAVGSPKDGEVFAAKVKEPVQVEYRIRFS